MANIAQDKEIQQYRDLMAVPDHFPHAFGLKMVVAALFIGFIMVPGSIYLSLFSGGGLGGAAQWVTVILFAEVARRSMKDLKQQEIFLLFYMTGIALGGQLGGGVLSQLLWSQYLVQAPPTIGMGVADEIPSWWAPSREVLEQSGRTFFHQAWLAPILFIVGMMFIGRIDHFGLGYALYRLTAHVEKLPFPMAPMGALGVTALAESRDKPTERWRWRCFSLGGVLGLGFGFIYIGIPSLTSTFFGAPVKILPIPWLDLTPILSTEEFIPAMPMTLVFDAGLILVGMVLPFWAMVGGFIGLVITMILNPILRQQGVLTSWEPGMGMVETLFNNNLDFYLSFGIGLMLAIFFISLIPIVRGLMKLAKTKTPVEGLVEESTWQVLKRELFTRNKERGDFAVQVSLLIYFGSTFAYIGLSTWLIPQFPWKFFLGFAMIYQPIISYAHAKLEGLVGQAVAIPLVREAAYLLSGYSGAAIWFAPIPLGDYGGATRGFRQLELLGTRLIDLIKVELVAIPVLLIASFLFSEMIWRMAAIPSATYPFTQEFWELQALNFSLTVTATSEGTSPFLEAIKFDVIGIGLTAGVVTYALLSLLSMPTFLIFGVVRGLGQTIPGAILSEFLGALIARFVLEKKFGKENFKRYIMIVSAGFAAGVGLIGMAAIAFALIAKSTTMTGY